MAVAAADCCIVALDIVRRLGNLLLAALLFCENDPIMACSKRAFCNREDKSQSLVCGFVYGVAAAAFCSCCYRISSGIPCPKHMQTCIIRSYSVEDSGIWLAALQPDHV